jgi:aldehyde dehydrogenase (NAD+)
VNHYPHLYIDGAWVEPTIAARHEVINPTTERPVASVSLGGAEDVDRAVRAARAAFATFGTTPKAERIALLDRIIKVYTARQSEVAATVIEEMGSPVKATVQVAGAHRAVPPRARYARLL